MTEILLFTSCLLLTLLCLILFIRLQKERTHDKSAPSLPFEDIFNTLSTPIFYKNGNDYQANRAFYRAFGTFAKEAFEKLDTLPRHGQHTLELIFDNGISKHVLIYCSALHARDNTLLGHSGILFDTSSLTKSKELLLAQKERLELSIEGSGDGIWDWDMKSEKTFFSKTWKSIMGYSDDDRPSSLSSWLNLVHPKDMALVNEELKKHLDKKNEFFFVEHRLRDTNPLQWITVRGQALFDKHDKPTRMLGTIRDITARKANEEKQHKELALFVSFFEHLPTIAFIKNMSGQYLYLNSTYQRYIGFKTWQFKSAEELFDRATAQSIIESDRLATYEGLVEQRVELPTEEGLKESFAVFKFLIETDEGEKLLCGFGVMINKPFT